MNFAGNVARVAAVLAAVMAWRAGGASAQRMPNLQDKRLLPVVKLGDKVANGVTVSADKRVFLCMQGPAQFPGVQIAEWKDGGYIPYPNIEWDAWHAGEDAAKGFVHVNSLRVGPEGDLWVVDTGGLGLAKPTLPGGPKIVRINLKTNEVRRVYPLPSPLTKAKSFVDDIRFHGTNAYLTDAGEPGMIVLNTQTGIARRVLDNHFSMTAHLPMSGEGKVLYGGDGKPAKIHADQMEVTQAGDQLYFQPQTGPLYQIPTRYLDDEKVTDAERARHIKRFVQTPSTGGTAIDAQGNLYVSDTNRLRIWKIAPSGKKSILISDPRLLWADALWIDDAGYLWIPCAQQNRTLAFQQGISRVRFPIVVYKIFIGAKPVRK